MGSIISASLLKEPLCYRTVALYFFLAKHQKKFTEHISGGKVPPFSEPALKV